MQLTRVNINLITKFVFVNMYLYNLVDYISECKLGYIYTKMLYLY